MTVPATRDETRARGDNFPFQYEAKQADNSALDISTGYTFRFTVDPSDAPTSAGSNAFQVNGVVTNGPLGKVEFRPTPTQMNLNPDQDWFYDIQMKDPQDYLYTMVKGKLIISQDITKDTT